MEILAKILIFLLTWNFQSILTQIPDRSFIDNYLKSSTLDLINQESKLMKRLDFYYKLVSVCSSNWKASNISTNFTDELDNHAFQIQQTMYIQNHQFFNDSLDRLDDYNYALYQISRIFHDKKRLEIVFENLQLNASKIYESNKDVLRQYHLNFINIRKVISKNRLINSVNLFVRNYISEIASYSKDLRAHITNRDKLITYFSTLKTSKLISIPTNDLYDNFTTDLRAIEPPLISTEREIKNLSEIALLKVEKLQTLTVTVRKVQKGKDISQIFSKVSHLLKKNLEMDDFNSLGWPLFPDISGTDSDMCRLRSRMCDDKTETYQRTKTEMSMNLNELKKARDEWIAKTYFTSGKMVQAPSPDALDAMDSVENVENAMKSYFKLLTIAIEKVDVLRDDQIFIIDYDKPYESKICGDFVPYVNTLIGHLKVMKRGFIGGTYLNKKPFIVGRSTIASTPMSPLPARIFANETHFDAFAIDSVKESTNGTKFYLRHNSNLIWIPANQGNVFSKASLALKYLGSGGFPMMIARYNKSGVSYLGRAHFGKGLYGMHYYDPSLKKVVNLLPNDTFEVLGCTNSTPTPCGTFVPYSSITARTEPRLKAVQMGYTSNGDNLYLGYARTTCNNVTQNYAARLSANLLSGSAYVPCYDIPSSSSSEMLINATKGISYLADSPLYNWVTTNMDSFASVPNIFKYNSSVYMLGFVRISTTSNYTIFGRITLDGPNVGIHSWNSGTASYSYLKSGNKSFDILTCG